VLLVSDPTHPEQERSLESFYLNFAQPNSLTMKQCMVVGGDGCGRSRTCLAR